MVKTKAKRGFVAKSKGKKRTIRKQGESAATHETSVDDLIKMATRMRSDLKDKAKPKVADQLPRMFVTASR